MYKQITENPTISKLFVSLFHFVLLTSLLSTPIPRSDHWIQFSTNCTNVSWVWIRLIICLTFLYSTKQPALEMGFWPTLDPSMLV